MRNIDISGKWSFFIDEKSEGLKHDISAMEFCDSIELPSTASEAKKTRYNPKRNSGFLTDHYYYKGMLWYQKKIDIKGFSEDCVYTLLLERTRNSALWIDGRFVGEQNSLCTAHIYDISKYASSSFTVTVMTDNSSYQTVGGHMTSRDTQTNWNGILGKMTITEEKCGVLHNIRLYPSAKTRTLQIEAELIGAEKLEADFYINDKRMLSKQLNAGANRIVIDTGSLGTWSDSSPALHELKIIFDNENEYKSSFGLRDFKIDGRHFTCNDQRVFLRGKHDGMIFPMTGYAPMDTASWLEVMSTAKRYGINHYRFHTCCPPEAAFCAADILGIFLEPELPFWGTICGRDEKDFNESEQNFLITEGKRILDAFANHPSFVMFSLGNELWGDPARISEILEILKRHDNRPLYTCGSNNFQFCPLTTENEDFFVGVRFSKDALLRGSYATCDAPLGFVQTEMPNTKTDYDIFFNAPQAEASGRGGEIQIQHGTGVKTVSAASHGEFLPEKPVITHEIGQYSMYPDYSELKLYSGVLKPDNYCIFKERLENAGLGEYANDFFENSSKLAVFCYKLELEAALRSRNLAGFQVLDIQDFTGQGTAIVGILNPFMQPKGIVTEREWRGFCSQTVLLASFDSFLLCDGDVLNADILISDYSENGYDGRKLKITFGDACSEYTIGAKGHCVEKIAVLSKKIEGVDKITRKKLLLEIEGTEISNSYIFELCPRPDKATLNLLNALRENGTQLVERGVSRLHAVTDAEIAKCLLARGESVLLISNRVNGVKGMFSSDFWCYHMFRKISLSMNKEVPTGTLGLSINRSHGALSHFASQSHSTPLWYRLVVSSVGADLSGTKLRPVVRVIDNVDRNANLGMIFEANVLAGKLLVCTSPLHEISESAEAVCLAKSLADYCLSGFCPEETLSEKEYDNIFMQENEVL